jgi:hypothetical protein
LTSTLFFTLPSFLLLRDLGQWSSHIPHRRDGLL